MRARDYLVGLGLAKPGARGRFSLDAKRALAKAMSEGTEFSDYNADGMVKPDVKPKSKIKPKAVIEKVTPKKIAAIPVRKKVVANTTVSRIRVRNENVFYGVEIGEGYRSDLVVAFTNCAACYKAVGYCSCSAPKLPKWIGGGIGMLVRPNI